MCYIYVSFIINTITMQENQDELSEEQIAEISRQAVANFQRIYAKEQVQIPSKKDKVESINNTSDEELNVLARQDTTNYQSNVGEQPKEMSDEEIVFYTNQYKEKVKKEKERIKPTTDNLQNNIFLSDITTKKTKEEKKNTTNKNTTPAITDEEIREIVANYPEIVKREEQREQQDLLETIHSYLEVKKDLESGKTSLSDYGAIVSILTDEEGNVIFASTRNVPLKADKIYLDNETKEQRVDYKNNAIITYLNQGEKLGDIIEYLPYGLIDKKITGIGATTLEMKAKRNSIIVMPTKALAYNKYKLEKNALLVLGSSYLDMDRTSDMKIQGYITDKSIEYKKILVVADNIERVINLIEDKDENIYQNYFLMVDEIDVLQFSNNHRPRISKIVDYYFKFKLRQRALVSATINEFTHPLLKKEDLTIFTYKEPVKREIDLIHTSNINKVIADVIIEKAESNDKILIAYNSISNILITLKLLPLELQNQCGVLCSNASKEDVKDYYSKLDEKGFLEKRITFMTSSFFSGIDINDGRCHLITVSNTNKAFSVLTSNTITQIYGRLRYGALSDTIIYNSFSMEDATKWSKMNIEKYRQSLSYKATMVVKVLDSMNDMATDEQNIDESELESLRLLFKRIEFAIIEKGTEKLLGMEQYKLVRYNTDKCVEIAYFNIDALCEKMRAYSRLYSSQEGLYKELSKYHVVKIKDYTSEYSKEQQIIEKQVIQSKTTYIRERLIEAKNKILELNKDNKLSIAEFGQLLEESTSEYEKLFYQRLGFIYSHIEITNNLIDKLIKAALGNKKSYRNFKNSVSFWLLDKKHPFKSQVLRAFKKNQKYNSKEIEEILSPIIEYHFFKKISKSRLVNHFKCYFKCTYTGGKYLVKKENPLNLPKPLKEISKNEMNLNKYFEI